jgi:tight adherence protein C
MQPALGWNAEFIIAGTALFVAVFLLGASGYPLLARIVPRRRAAQNEGPRLSIEDEFLRRFARLLTPSSQTEMAGVRLRLVRAGYRRPSAIRVFYLVRAVSALALTLAAMAVVMLVGAPLPLQLLPAVLFLPFALGFLAPSFWVSRRAKYRSLEAELAFPDVLDMLLVCVEAGQSFDQACLRVSRNIGGISKVLYDEFGVMNDELRAGGDRTLAFRDFAARLKVRDINSFVTVLRQSDEFGVSIADALRVYAADMRNRRLMRAEEKANLMPLKLAIGSMAFTVPPTMLITAGPSLLMIMRAFGTMGG